MTALPPIPPADVWRGKLVLITGGLGFIGSNLAHRLAGAGARVTLVDSLIPEYGGNPFNVADIQGQVQVNIPGDRAAVRAATVGFALGLLHEMA